MRVRQQAARLSLSKRAAPARARSMSFAVSRTAVVAAGARAPHRASAKARVSCAPASRAPSGSFFRATHLRGSPALRAAEDDETPAPAPAPEELSFPELSDDEEVKGAQITAIITGASRTRTDRRDGRLPVVIPIGPTWRATATPPRRTCRRSVSRLRHPDPSSSVSRLPFEFDRRRERRARGRVPGAGAGHRQPRDAAPAAGGHGHGGVPARRAKMLKMLVDASTS